MRFSLNTIPNIMTISRLVLIPFVCYFIIAGMENDSDLDLLIADLLFSIGAITDFLDGYLARQLKIESNFGKCFDNIADKMLNVAIICILLSCHKIWLIPGLVVILREVFMSAMREYAAMNKREISIEMSGKIKTTLQFLAIIMIVLPRDVFLSNWIENYFGDLMYCGNVLFLISTILTVYTGIKYTYTYFK